MIPLRHLTSGGIAWFVVLCGIATSVPAALLNVSNPANILPGPGRTVTVSSAHPTFGNQNAVIDNLAPDAAEDASFLFAQTSPDLISIAGFNGRFEFIRIFTAADPTREPTSVSVRSSTSVVTTLNSGDYETDLGTVPFTLPITLVPYAGSGRGYFDVLLPTAAPAGTQSLFMSMTAPTSGIRLYEVQAMPEPASALLVVGLGLGLGLRRSRR